MSVGLRITSSIRLAALTAAVLAAGCATTTSPTRSPEISSRLRHVVADDAASKEAAARQLFVRGMTEAHIGNHAAALELYDEALRLAPNTAAMLAAAAESHAALGDETSAIYHARKANDLAPDNIHYQFQLAQLHLASGATEKAAELYRVMHEQFPSNPEVLYELARVRTMVGKFDEAIAAYRMLLDEVGDDRDVQNEMLRLYMRTDDDEGTERMLLEMIENQPHDAQLHRMLGELYLKLGRREDAAAQLQQALRSNPADAETLLSLTDLYRSLGRADSANALLERAATMDAATPAQLLAQVAPLYARSDDDPDARNTAEQILDRILEMDPNNDEALVMLGDIRLSQERFEEAGDLLYRALQVNPRDPHLWVQAAGSYWQAGTLEKAADVADEGLLLFPGSLPLLRISGYALLDSYRNQEAIDRFEEAIRIVREDSSEAETDLAEMYGALGLLYTRVGEIEKSDEAYEAAISRDPDNSPAMNNYAYHLAERKVRLDRALELAQRAVEISPEVASFMDTLGWVHFQRGEFDHALKWLKAAADTGEASAAVYEHLGDVHSAVGNAGEAQRAWRSALKMNPDDASLKRKVGLE